MGKQNQDTEGNEALILVVDDNQVNVKVLSNILKMSGYDIIAAFNGKDAIRMAERRPPDLILMDIMMPDINGFEATRQLKEKEELKDIPVLFISALTEVEDKVKGFEVGGQDYITKPFQHQEVLKRVELHNRLFKLEKEREKHIQQLKEQKSELEKLNEAKDKLLRVVSHDMRNPLYGIIGISELLSEEYNEMGAQEQLDMLASIQNSGQRLYQLVNDLLDAAKIEESELNVSPEEFDVQEAIHSVLEMQRPSARLKHIDIDFENDLDHEQITLDKPKFTQMLGNLVSNSIKFTEEGGRIHIKTSNDNMSGSNSEDYWILKIEDDGIGMDHDVLQNLFDKSKKQLRKGTAGEASTGLGMPIVKQFVDSMNGSIKVDSEPGQGTTFTMRLPLNINNLSDAAFS